MKRALLLSIVPFLAILAVMSAPEAQAYRFVPGSESYEKEREQLNPRKANNSNDYSAYTQSLADRYAQRSIGADPQRLQDTSYDVSADSLVSGHIDTTRFDRQPTHSGAPVYGKGRVVGKGRSSLVEQRRNARLTASVVPAPRPLYREPIAAPPPVYETVYPPAYMGYTIETGIHPDLYHTGLETWFAVIAAIGLAGGFVYTRRNFTFA